LCKEFGIYLCDSNLQIHKSFINRCDFDKIKNMFAVMQILHQFDCQAQAIAYYAISDTVQSLPNICFFANAELLCANDSVTLRF
jgi:hypothetical protein